MEWLVFNYKLATNRDHKRKELQLRIVSIRLTFGQVSVGLW